MTETAADRKKRLAAMRQSAASKESAAKAEEETHPGTGASEKKIKFRNYAPYDTSLEAQTVSATVDAVQEEVPASKRQRGASDRAVEKKPEAADIIKQELEKQKAGGASDQVLAHKKIDHDLKLLMAGKLHKLQKRTHRAIVDIMREKLASVPDN